jgi:hypothetical protein
MPGTGLTRASSAIGNFLWHKVMPHILPLLRLLLRSNNIHTQAETGKNMAFVILGEGDVKALMGCILRTTGRRGRVVKLVMRRGNRKSFGSGRLRRWRGMRWRGRLSILGSEAVEVK